MTDTQKLLELAAQSINLVYEWKHDQYWGGETGVVPQGYLRCWNPLNRDDDAVQLISELQLNIMFRKWLNGLEIVIVEQSNTGLGQVFEPSGGKYRLDAIRRAVTRSAAQIQLTKNKD